MGPMVAGARFLDLLRRSPFHAAGLRARLHDSLAFTGKGNRPTAPRSLALPGSSPRPMTPPAPRRRWPAIAARKVICPPDLPEMRFDPETDLVFDFGPSLPGHANGMVLMATDSQGDVILQETYYSIGGGFVLTEAEHSAVDDKALNAREPVPHPFPLCGRDAGDGARLGQDRRADGLTFERTGDFRSDAEIIRGTCPDLGGDEFLHRTRHGDGWYPARGPQGAAPRQGDPRTTDRGTQAEPDRAAHHQRLDEPLRHGGERGRSRRRSGR